MINAIINGLFNLVTKLAEFITTPLINAIMLLFPSVGNFFGYITTYLGYFIQYIPMILNMALIPRGAMVLLFDFYIIIYSIYLVQIGYKFIIKVYNYFKF